MALVEMSFTKTWFTIPRESFIIFSCQQCTEFIPSALGPGYQASDYTVQIPVPFGYYTDMNDVIKAINDAIVDKLYTHTFPIIAQNGERRLTNINSDKWPRVRYNEIKKKVFVTISPGLSLTFSDTLCTICGIRVNPLTNGSNVVKVIPGATTSDINGGIHNLYVYCDILENVPVGDTESPLLRVVDTSGRSGESIHHTFEQPRYVPIQKKRFDSIEIDIKDDVGQPIAFETGKLFVVLHFRRASSPYFST